MTAHNFVKTEKECEKYFDLVFCTKCGYVAFFGNDNSATAKERRDNLPPSCIDEAVVMKVSAIGEPPEEGEGAKERC